MVRILIINCYYRHIKALAIAGASALRSGQSEVGLALVIFRLRTLTLDWGVGGQLKDFGYRRTYHLIYR